MPHCLHALSSLIPSLHRPINTHRLSCIAPSSAMAASQPAPPPSTHLPNRPLPRLSDRSPTCPTPLTHLPHPRQPTCPPPLTHLPHHRSPTCPTAATSCPTANPPAAPPANPPAPQPPRPAC